MNGYKGVLKYVRLFPTEKNKFFSRNKVTEIILLLK